MPDLSDIMSLAGRSVDPAPRPVPSLQGRLSDTMLEAGALNSGQGDTWADVQRILDLSVTHPLSRPELDGLSRLYCLESAWRRGFRLHEEQANALLAFDQVGGLFAPVPVGRGKTLITLAIASRAFVKGVRKSIILVPSSTVGGFMGQIPEIRTWVPIQVPVFVCNGKKSDRLKLANSRTPGTYILPYSMLSTEDAVDLLNGIDPGLIIADEVHMLKDVRGAGRTKRVSKFMQQHPATKFVGLSGTITNKSIKDYWHLMTWALGKHSPMPLSYWVTQQLSAVLDSEALPSKRQIQEWSPLIRWARKWFPQTEFPADVSGLRKAFSLRMTTAPGVVASEGGGMSNIKLVLRNTDLNEYGETREGWQQMIDMIEQVETMGISPAGDEIAHAIHMHKWFRELTVGFYNQLVWPEPEVLARRRNIDLDDAQQLLDKAVEHHAAKQEYAQHLRDFFKKGHKDKLDTPMLVGQSMDQHGSEFVGHDIYKAWSAMKALEFEDMPVRDRCPVRVCDYKIQHAVSWAKEHGNGIIWYHHQEIGKWIMEELVKAGVTNAIHCFAGENDPILDKANADKIIVATIPSHGTGKNLQHHTKQLHVECPRGAHVLEQLLGRVHRTGQTAEKVVVDTLDSLMFDVMNRAAGLVDGLYQSQSTGNPMRIIYCEYLPIPMMMPSEVLRERGFENKLLTDEQQAQLEQKFNKPLALAEAKGRLFGTTHQSGSLEPDNE